MSPGAPGRSLVQRASSFTRDESTERTRLTSATATSSSQSYKTITPTASTFTPAGESHSRLTNNTTSSSTTTTAHSMPLAPSASSPPQPQSQRSTPQQEQRRKRPSVRRDGTTKWWGIVHMLDNKGSVARDHLADERTYLAWLRTSLSLASIGIAITQLFRLGTSQTGSQSSVLLRQLATTTTSSSSSSGGDDSANTLEAQIANLIQLVTQQQSRIDSLETQLKRNPARYRHLGKPVGGTFIVLALVFLLLGTRRYFKVQQALMREPTKFPPSRRSVAFASFAVATVSIVSFSVIMATR